jgi:hypothetical protein
MNNQELAEQIAIAKKSYKTNTYKSYRECFEAGIAAIVEAMDAPAKEGMKWVKASERLPEKGKQVFWNRHEEYPVWAYYSKDGRFHNIVMIDSSGEEEAEPLNYDWEWLDESAPAKEAISDSPKAGCPNCKETSNPCACLRNLCLKCGEPVGNITFSVCDDCWESIHPKPAKEAISVPAQQPSLEEKKEDLVASSSANSTVPCDAPFINNKSIEL